MVQPDYVIGSSMNTLSYALHNQLDQYPALIHALYYLNPGWNMKKITSARMSLLRTRAPERSGLWPTFRIRFSRLT